MGLQVDVKEAIYAMVHAMKPLCKEGQAICIHIDHRQNFNDQYAGGHLSFVIRPWHGTFNTFVSHNDDWAPAWKTTDGIEKWDFKNISNHDTCWRDAMGSECFEAFMTGATKIIKDMKGVAPADVNQFTWFKNVDVCEVELERTGNAYGDRYRLVGFKKNED